MADAIVYFEKVPARSAAPSATSSLVWRRGSDARNSSYVSQMISVNGSTASASAANTVEWINRNGKKASVNSAAIRRLG